MNEPRGEAEPPRRRGDLCSFSGQAQTTTQSYRSLGFQRSANTSQLHSLSGPAGLASLSLPKRGCRPFLPPLRFGDAFAGCGEWILAGCCASAFCVFFLCRLFVATASRNRTSSWSAGACATLSHRRLIDREGDTPTRLASNAVSGRCRHALKPSVSGSSPRRNAKGLLISDASHLI
jgi:hypothetical protein